MIAIVNVGPHNDADPMGERTYEVRINAQVITTFRHKRSDGLGRCLLAASKAVEKQKWMDVETFLSGKDQDEKAGGKAKRTRKPSGLQNAWRRMVEDEPGEFLRVSEVKELLGFASEKPIRRAMQRGRLPYFRFGRTLLLKREDVLNSLKRVASRAEILC